MSEATPIKYLPTALVIVGLIFVFGIYPLTILWPSGWSWHTGQSHYLQMILGIYATLGRFSVGRQPQTSCPLEPHLVYGMVQHCARRDHGCAVCGQP